MTIETKEIQKTEQVTAYIADDGTKFSNISECKKYERDCVLKSIMQDIDMIPNNVTHRAGEDIPYVGYDDCIRAFKIRDISDVETINRWLELEYGDECAEYNMIGEAQIGTTQLFVLRSYDDPYRLGSAEHLKQDMAITIDYWANVESED